MKKDDQRWKLDYYRYSSVFADGTNNYDGKSLRALIKNMKISHLYKFRSGNLNDIINLNNNQLPICSIKAFNDPFEFLYLPNINKELFEKYDKDSLMNIYEAIDTLNDEFKVCSFSQYKENILMWSHYANYHKGFCIEYEIEEILRKNPNLFPVMYSNEIIDKKENDMRYMLRKSLDWQYECEWRIIDINYEKSSLYSLVEMPRPVSIYLGCKIEEGLKGYLINYCKNNNIKVYNSTINRERYELNFNEIKL